MHTPAHFREHDLARLHDLIDAFNFGILTTCGGDGRPDASHLPFVLDRGTGDLGVLHGHVGRANDQWRSLQNDAAVLVIFNGPDAYISPTRYLSIGVPTWNYVSVHAYGTANVADDPGAVRTALERLVAFQERKHGTDWRIDSLPSDDAEALVRQLVAFEIRITHLEGKWKLGQNRDDADRINAGEGLAAGGDPVAAALGKLMLDELKRR
ncbi:MAG: FMN-binding negative transcriptional regulator [Acidobacteriota bacterium]|nr:FMN-binding negative transcriptional regulator [Acidobacteriota bacterium]